MRTKLLLGFISLALISLSCDPKKDPEPQEQDFSCIKIFDLNGQGLGLHGSCSTSNDWGNFTLNADEQAYLNFSDTVSLEGTTAVNGADLFVFPCPVKIGTPISIYTGGDTAGEKVKLKIAIVDESLNIVQQLAIKVETGNGLQLMIDPTKFESGKYYRMYYRVSATGAASLYEGYGNFLVCKTWINGVTTTIESDCF